MRTATQIRRAEADEINAAAAYENAQGTLVTCKRGLQILADRAKGYRAQVAALIKIESASEALDPDLSASFSDPERREMGLAAVQGSVQGLVLGIVGAALSDQRRLLANNLEEEKKVRALIISTEARIKELQQ